MDARGGKPHQQVAHLHFAAIDELGFLHRTDGEAGDVVFVLVVHVRHLGGLAADEGAVGHDATVGHALDDGLDLGRVVFTHGDVVEEKQRCGALGEHVVDAHGHSILPDNVVLVHHEGDFELGAHTISAADKDRFLIVERSEVEHAAKAADVAHHAGTLRGRNVLLDTSHRLIAGLQCHTRLFVRFCHILFYFEL